jgi:hypothetical protein
MSEERILSIAREIIKTLTLDRIEDDAIINLWKIFLDSYKHLKEKGLTASKIFDQMYGEIKTREGIVDAWLNLILLTTFAAGIAYDRTIKIYDVDITTARICDQWPKCPEKRISNVMKILKLLIEWYDLTQK